jgi:hypothetical protein
MVWTSLIAQGKRRLWMSLFVAILVGLVYVHFARFYQDRVAGWILGLIALPLVLNLIRAGAALVFQLDRHPFARLDFGLSSDQASPGGGFEIEIRAEPKRSATLKRLEAELRCTKHQLSEHGKQMAILHQETLVLAKDVALEAGQKQTFRGTLRLSPSSPYSFRSMEGKIRWAIYVMVEIGDWGELRDEIEVTVAPG